METKITHVVWLIPNLGERLAVHARQLAVEPHVQVILKSLLLRLEQAHRSTLAHYDHRNA